VVLIENGRVHTLSSAGLRIARRLRWPWPVLAVLLIVPKPLRDIPYRWVARNRYRWFGKREACMTPTSDIRSRFLD
jgi:predicted DCC family thiol-disulfide oxidoreductase YuxK